MPTDEWFKDNPKISAYISSDLFNRFEEWRVERGIKKVSQALTRILEEHLGVVQVEPIQSTGSSDRLEELEAKLAELTQRFEGLEGAIAATQTPVESELPVNQSSNSQLSILEEPLEEEVVQAELITPEVWTTKQLQDVGVSPSSLRRWKEKEQLPKNSKGYTIVKWAGKLPGKTSGDLWEVQKVRLPQEEPE